MNSKKIIGLAILSALIIPSAPSYSELAGFRGLQTGCINALGGMDAVNNQLMITDADNVSLSLNVKGVKSQMTLPGVGLKKLKNPGGGACCLFDDTANLVDQRIETNGNDGCKAWKEMKSRELGKNLHSGIWWCTGPEANCFMDWWYQ